MKQLSTYPEAVPQPTGVDNGLAINETAPGAQNGTPIDVGLINDVYYGMYALIAAAGNSPSGSEENTSTSDVLTAVNTLIAGSANPFMQYAHFRDEKASGTAMQNLTAGYNTRELTTEKGTNPFGATLGSNQITLLAGTYRIAAMANAQVASSSKTKLLFYNVTDDSYDVVGLCSGGVADDDFYSARVSGTITVASTKVFELRQYTSSTGLLPATGDGTVEVYSEVEIWKVG